MKSETRQQAIFLFVLMPILFAGCAGTGLSDPGPGKRVDVTVSKSGYASGETVDVTVKNVSNLTLTYPLVFCKTELQREVSSTWTTVQVPSDGCRLALAILEARQSTINKYVLPTSLPSGIYRLAMPTPTPENAKTAEPPLTTPSFSVNSVTFGP
jgi:hypothetical protein